MNQAVNSFPRGPSAQVAVNGKHVLLYAHRLRPEEVDTLGIYGRVHIHSVGFSFSSVSAATSCLSGDAF